MSGRLIYRCGRFLDQGYVTLVGGGRTDATPRDDDAVWQAFREGKQVSGASGHVWTVLSEGRDVQEVLAFVHSAGLAPAVEARLKSLLRALADKELPVILADVRKRNLAPSEARSVLKERLDRAAQELSIALPEAMVSAAPPKPVAGRSPPPLKGLLAGCACIAVAGLLGLAYWPGGPGAAEPEPDGPSRDEIIAVATPCFPEIAQSAKIDALSQAFAKADWRDESPGKHDYLRALTEEQRQGILVADQTPADLCSARHALWDDLSRLQNVQAQQLDAKLTETREALTPDRTANLPLLDAIAVVVTNLSGAPLPPKPADCALDLCLPLVDMADITAKQRLETFYNGMARALATDPAGLPYRLREEEVKLRGEMSLAGLSPTDLLDHFAPLWTCGTEEACTLPLQNAPVWLDAR